MGADKNSSRRRWELQQDEHDIHHTSPLRVLVCFGSEGCLLVPRTSSTPVAAWFWQTEGRSVEHVILGVRPS
jgi:hypothetical protein